jgi:hypothetical protein
MYILSSSKSLYHVEMYIISNSLSLYHLHMCTVFPALFLQLRPYGPYSTVNHHVTYFPSMFSCMYLLPASRSIANDLYPL